METLLNKLKKYIPKTLFKKLQPIYHFALSFLSALLNSFPSNRIIVIGITGTTGKTTSTYFLAKALRRAGYKVGFTSTAMFSDGKSDWLNKKKMTMIGRSFTQKMLNRMIKNGCQYAIIETTSEGIRQFRHRFINYDLLVFTGIYPEHIESHGSFENYKNCKLELFKHLKRGKPKYIDENHQVITVKNDIKKLDLDRVKKTIAVNGDDEYAGEFLDVWAQEKVAYTRHSKQEYLEHLNQTLSKELKNLEILSYKEIETTTEGTKFTVNGEEMQLKVLGAFNVENSLNALAIALKRGVNYKQIKEAFLSIKSIPGRLEKIEAGQKFLVIVDYSFEPRALTKLYETVEVINKPVNEGNKIIHVLGSAGGGRDKARRPKLGKIAGERADYVIITNEDPYDEDPECIIKEVAEGSFQADKKINENLFLVTDRREAIKKAFSLAQEEDIVLITGKGNEQAICVKDGKKMEWDDREVAREELKNI